MKQVMNVIKWTEDQNKAIKNKDINLLVSAAAGSGKTAVLVERIIDTLLKEKIDIDEFLIVTFTNAAARDMKKKIQKNLSDRIKDKNPENYKIRKQINKLNSSFISTIHAFCTNIIKKYYYLIEIDPNFMISETEENEIIFNEAMEEILEESYAENSPEFQSLVDNYSENRGDIKLENLIKETYSSIQSYAYPISWLENSVEKLKDNSKDNIWFRIIKKEITDLLLDAESLLKNMENLIDYDGPGEKYKDTLDGDFVIVNNLKERIDVDIDQFVSYYNSINYVGLARIPKAKQDLVCEDFKGKREIFKSIIKEIGKNLPNDNFDNLIKTTRETYRPMKGLFKVIKKLDKKFKELKNEKGLLDFNDLEHYALELLDYEEVSNYYRNKFKYIYIDEYQDSNEVQETIINRIKRNNNLFMVGDVKQSIYRFRQADPGIFMSKFEEYTNQNNKKNMLINLNKNFRSRKEILNSINYLFNKIMSKKLGEVEYLRENYLYNGINFETNEISEDVELNIFNKTKDEDNNDIDEEILLLENSEIEAKMAATKIKELVGSKTYDREKGWRELEYRDIVILLRATRGTQGVYEEVFSNENIPLYADSNEGYFDSIEIKIIINLLKLIDNFKQDIPLLSVMRSIIGGFTVEDLVKIRLEFKNMPYYESVLKYSKAKDDNVSKKINKFIDNVKLWREQNKFLDLNKLIWNILIETDYYYFVGMLPKGEIRQANLRLLVDKANNFERTKMSGLIKFLKYIDNIKSSSKDMGTARVLGENDNVVRLMSIHKSKGLEFPVVVISGLDKKFNLMNSSKDVIVHNTCKLAPKNYNIKNKTTKETLPRLASKTILKKEDLSEEMRVLYVGMTRAIDKLIMIGTVNNLVNKKEKWKQGTDYFNLYTSNSYLDWIGRSLYNHKDCELLRTNNDEVKEDDEFFSSWNINILSYDNLRKEEKKLSSREILFNNIIDMKNKDEVDFKDIDELLSWNYHHEKEEIPTKVSVTELNKLKTENYSDMKLKIPTISELPTFKQKEGSFTGQEIGTITHFVLQMIKLKKDMDKNYIEEEIERMIIKKQLTEEEAKALNLEKIYRFYNSIIGKRMLKSARVHREEPFIIKKKYSEIKSNYANENKEILVQGIIDCFFYENDEIILIDYKTDSLYSKTVEDLVKEYRYQLIEYKRAIELITKSNVTESYIYLMTADKFIKVF